MHGIGDAEASQRALRASSELRRCCAAGSPARAEEELEQGRLSSLEQDEQDELAPLPPPGGPRPGGVTCAPRRATCPKDVCNVTTQS